MIKLDEVEQEWNQDCLINPVELDQASLDSPKLHSKYIRYYNKVRLHILSLEDKLADEMKIKNLYYSGRMSKEEYEEFGLEPFPLKILKTDIKFYLESDPSIKKIKNRIEYYKIFLDCIKSIIDQINRRSFEIKNIIEHRKFTSGEV
jgi:hypothetical protein